MPTERSARVYWLLILATALIYLGVAGYLSRTLLTWDDEGAYLSLGRLAVLGNISLYQDDLTGQRMPLPFYVVGVSQVLFGRNLWAGRLVSAALGLGVLGLTIAVATRLQGGLAGILAGLLLATQGVIVGYYATATYHALTAAILMAAVLVLLKEDLPWRYALGMSIASLLFVTRTNMFPTLPFFFFWTLIGARSLAERLVVILVAGAPPSIFFLTDTTHLKLLAHVPILERLVAPLGYRSILSFSAIQYADLSHQLWAFVILARRFESWTLAATGLLVAALFLPRHEQTSTSLVGRKRSVLILGALFIWTLVWHFIIWRVNFRYAVAFFPSFAPLGAVLLALGFAAQFEHARLPQAGRILLRTTLAVALVVSLVFVRHPLLPHPTPWPFHGDAVQDLNRTAVALGALVPAEERVFLFAQPTPAYLAGLNPPLQQVMSAGGTLAAATSDARLVARSGAWGLVEIDRWLGREVQYAVISPQLLAAFATIRPEGVTRIRELLRNRFTLIGSVGDNPDRTADVYRRVNGQ